MTAAARNRRSLFMLAAVAATMCAAAWASVPLYDWFCRVTGFGGTTIAGESYEGQEILNRTVQIRFDASLERGMPWEFRPETTATDIRIGENALAYYVAHNPTSKPVAGTASYNVYPYSAGEYFIKIECFCFQMQVLEPGETVRMPVSFFVDPEIVDDVEAGSVNSITLSYTFHVAEDSEELASYGKMDGQSG
ncbi:MAG: cytochrome c oxidase assembly protein [Albidovulum sp.]|nr:cytochrome c oxidase assembly protein [Albidovulum sp.]MDE0306746.1 cytochrome c oxidase assembly protein [Albidovulum sp.]